MNKKTQEAIDKLNKVYGDGTVGILDKMKFKTYTRTSTGSLGLDIATGGGWPVGRIIEIYGWESTGKSTLCLHAIAEAQKARPERLCALIDTEHSFDRKYAKALGVDVDRLLVTQPDNGEQAFQTTIDLINAGEIGMMIFDSIAGARPKNEIVGDVGDYKIGLHARLTSQVFPQLVNACGSTETTLIVTNQMRNKIGGYGDPNVVTGGNASKFYTSLRVEQSRSVSQLNKVEEGGEVVGNWHKSKVVKNKTAPPFREAEYDIRYGEGVDTAGEILDYAVASELMKKSGTWYSYEGTKLGQGRNVVVQLLRDNDELAQELLLKIKAAYGIG